MGKNKRVSYYYDTDIGSFSYGYGHVMKPHRIKMAHSLISAYGLLPKLEVLKPTPASAEAMTRFHTDEYVHMLKRVTPETAQELTEGGTKFLTVLPGSDNPVYPGAFEFCSISAGGSLSSATRLASGSTDIAINWAGGLHHAKKTGASGFCYINDIVLGILELLRTYPRVLYIDVDCHHGDAVEEAFYTTDRVLTCSFHKFGDFFPGTGFVEDRGVGRGWRYAVNVPFRTGLNDQNFKNVFEPVMESILARYRPSAVVLQCGADSLAGDRLGQYNVSMSGHAFCVQYFRKVGLPLMILGGGGYTIRNVARTWCYETACALGVEDEEHLIDNGTGKEQKLLGSDLPYNQYFEYFGPEYKLDVKETNMEDLNESDRYLEGIRETVLRQISEIPIAPAVGIHMPPRHSVAEELGLGLDGADHVEGDYDDIDLRIQEIVAQVLTSSDSDTEPASPPQDAWGDENLDEDYPDTPTRSRSRKDHYISSSSKSNQYSRGTVSMPSAGLLFEPPTSRRPPNSNASSIFGGGGRTLDGGRGRVGDIMMRGGADACGVADLEQDPDGDFFMGDQPPQSTPFHPQRREIKAAPRRFFKPSGIRLAGTSDVRFPSKVLNNSTNLGTSWGPAGFGGFAIEDGVMKRGFGLSYGGWGGAVVAADSNARQVEEENEEEAEEEEQEELGRGRRRRITVMREEVVVDGVESD